MGNKKRKTHALLVKKGAIWLKKHTQNGLIPNCPHIATELYTVNNSGEIPDIVGWGAGNSVLIEVKTNRSDFKRDFQKVFRIVPENGMGEFRYYLCPTNMIKKEELPEKWGLLYINDDLQIKIVKKAKHQPANLLAERAMLLSILRRSKIKK